MPGIYSPDGQSEHRDGLTLTYGYALVPDGNEQEYLDKGYSLSDPFNRPSVGGVPLVPAAEAIVVDDVVAADVEDQAEEKPKRSQAKKASGEK